MLYRKLIMNLLAGLLAPIVFSVRWLPNVFDAVFYQRYEYYDFQIATLKDFLYAVYGKSYIFTLILSLLMVFFPLQLIKDYYRGNQKETKLTFFRKWRVLASIVLLWIVFFGLFTNLWFIPLYLNLIYLAFAAGFSLIFTIFFHYTLDRYED